MSRAKALLPLWVALAALSASGCSLVVGSFRECNTDAECTDGLTCDQDEHVCVGECRGLPQASIPGRYGSTASNAVVVGVVLPLTEANGSQNERSVQNWNAIRQAVDEINSRMGGVRSFALATCDTATKTEERVVKQIEWLADSQKAPASIVYRSDPVFAASAKAKEKHMLLMSPSATARDISQISDIPQGGTRGLVWRTAPSDELQARVIADILKGNGLGAGAGFGSISKVAIIYVDNSYGQGLNEALQSKLSTRTVRTFLFKAGDDASISAAVLGANSFDPDVTVLISQVEDARRVLTQGASQANLMKANGHKWFFTDATKSPDLLAGLSNSSEIDGSLGTAPAQNAGSGYAQFKDRFTAQFGKDPVQFAFTSHSYDAMYLVMLGSAFAAGTSPDGSVTGDRIAEGLTRVSSGQRYDFKPTDFVGASSALIANQTVDVSGASGELDFDPATGEAPSAFEVWQVSGTSFTSLGNVDPPTM